MSKLNKDNPSYKFWVIERYYGERLRYWTGRGTDSSEFNEDIRCAIKFADYESGCVILYSLLDNLGCVVEYGEGLTVSDKDTADRRTAYLFY